MVTNTQQSTPPRAGVLDRVSSFFVLLFAWVGLDRLFDHFNFLGHRSFLSSLLGGAIWATLMVLYAPGFSRAARRLGLTFRS